MASTLAEQANEFLSQKRIAVAGVSHTKTLTGNAIYKRLREVGYQVFAVNPNAEQVEGDVCYHDVKSIPGGVDGIIIVTSADITEQLVRDCADAGISRVWMHNGFHGGGASVSQSAVEFCKQHNITVISEACPLMFGKSSDGFHRFMKWCFQAVGQYPR